MYIAHAIAKECWDENFSINFKLPNELLTCDLDSKLQLYKINIKQAGADLGQAEPLLGLEDGPLRFDGLKLKFEVDGSN